MHTTVQKRALCVSINASKNLTFMFKSHLLLNNADIMTNTCKQTRFEFNYAFYYNKKQRFIYSLTVYPTVNRP